MNYTIDIRDTRVTVPLRSGGVEQKGAGVFLDGNLVLFLHPSLEDNDDGWVVAHASGYRMGYPDARSEEEAVAFAVATLADDEIRKTFDPDPDVMRERWPGSMAQDRLAAFCKMVAEVRDAEEEAVWLASAPTFEGLIERIHERPDAVEVELHEDEDRFIEWVESLTEAQHREIVAAIAEVYCGSGSQTEVTDIAEGNVEPGYTDAPLALGDWWVTVDGDLRESKVVPLLAACGVDSAFYDEWTTCHECCKVVRTSPDHYGWKRSYFLFHGCELVCHECITDDPEPYLEALSGDPNTAITIDSVDPIDHGYCPVWGEFENGLYGGQMDSPHAIARAFGERGWDDFIFSLDRVGQFDAAFTVYVKTHSNAGNGVDYLFEHGPFKFVAETKDPKWSWRTMLVEDESGEVRVFDCPDEAGKHGTIYVWPNFQPGETHAGEDPAAAMKRGLEAASRQMREAREEADATGGVVCSKVNADGSASTRVVSSDEFIAGINN
jgi:hypothetical protein